MGKLLQSRKGCPQLGLVLIHKHTYSDQALLDKHGLKSNDAILAEEKHMPIYEEITKLNPRYVAGGAAQNACRGAQVCTISPQYPRPRTTAAIYS